MAEEQELEYPQLVSTYGKWGKAYLLDMTVLAHEQAHTDHQRAIIPVPNPEVVTSLLEIHNQSVFLSNVRKKGPTQTVEIPYPKAVEMARLILADFEQRQQTARDESEKSDRIGSFTLEMEPLLRTAKEFFLRLRGTEGDGDDALSIDLAVHRVLDGGERYSVTFREMESRYTLSFYPEKMREKVKGELVWHNLLPERAREIITELAHGQMPAILPYEQEIDSSLYPIDN
jgi:hypothetical protein